MIPGGEGGGFDDGGMRNAPKRPSPGQAAVAGLFIERAECGRGANASLANRIMLLFKAVCKEERRAVAGPFEIRCRLSVLCRVFSYP